MSEQQRVFLAMLICMGIFFGWHFFVVKPAPPAAEISAPTAAAPHAADGAAGHAPTAAAALLPSGDVPLTPAQTRDFATQELRGSISNEHAALTSLALLAYNEHSHGAGPAQPVALVPPSGEGQARIDWDLGGAPQPTMHFADSATGFALRGQTAQGIDVSVDMQPGPQAYALHYVVRAHNGGANPIPAGAAVTLALAPLGKEEKAFLKPPADQVSALCSVAGSIERKQTSNLDKGPWTAPGPVAWTALDRQYFVAAVHPDVPVAGGCTVMTAGDGLAVRFAFPPETLAPGATWEKAFTLYLGPKADKYLGAVAPALTDVIDYNIWHIPLGFLARPMMFLLSVFQGWSGSWGLAIVLLTLLVKTMLFPFTYKSALSMRKMQLLKPELDHIKKQFENDKERQQLEQLKLFREKGVSPLGGCLPMLLQMPVWLALYRSLWSAVDLYQQPFLWLPDLTGKEPFPILALCVGGLQVLQTKLMPTSGMDPQQAKVMTFVMPVMMIMFMIAVPSGLVLYMLVNTILTIAQQLAINKRAVAL